MEEERFFNHHRENPRNLGFAPSSSSLPGVGSNSTTLTYNNSNSNNKAMSSSEMNQKPPPTPIVDRFRDLLKDREEELSILNGDDVPPPSIDEIVRMYEVVLSELTFNSKPIITELTMIAGEHKEYGEGIADAISARILEAPVDHKLPSLYLLDSIVKNIGGEYARYFASCLPEVFCEAYKQAHPSMYPAMRHLFRTWSAVFPPSVLHKIEVELQFSSLGNHQSSDLRNLRASESPSRPTHGIHVNPKYLEARRQFEHSTMGNDAEQNRAISPNLLLYGQKPDYGCDEYDINDAKDISSQIGSPRLGATGFSSRTTSTRGTERVVPSSRTSFSRIPSSPSSSGLARPIPPSGELFTEENSPGRVVDRTSPSYSRLKYSPDSMRVQDVQRHDWWMNTSTVRNTSDEYSRQAPRALIDAYGNHRDRDSLKEKPLKIEHIDVNGFENRTVTKGWQNTEEEEYLWEEMSPTLDDRSRGNDIRSSRPDNARSTRTPFGGFGAELTAPDFRRSNWPQVMKDEISILEPDSEAMSRPGTLSEAREFSSSHNPQGHRNSQFHHPLSSQHVLNGVNGRATLPSFPMPGVTSLAYHNLSSRSESYPYTEPHIQRLPNVMSRTSSSTPDSLSMEVLPSITTSTMEKHMVGRPHSPSIGQFAWHPAHINQSHAPILPQQQLDVTERKPMIPSNNLQFPNHQTTIGSSSQQSRGEAAPLQSQLHQPPGTRELFISPTPSQTSSHIPLYHGHAPQGYGAGRGPISLGQAPRELPYATTHPLPNAAYHSQRPALPPLPPGPPHTSAQMVPIPQNTNPSLSHQTPSGALSGLFSSLMAQGLISLTPQDSVGTDFRQDLKVRHEYVTKALYADLPRQCTACGLRFKCREDHSNHMDWHVTRNRVSRNRKQKPSRKWFVSTNLWLSGAEALGNDAVPGFLPAESTVEKKDDKDMAVPADEDQIACALCGEPFDDFYSDEAEEWMYREAVYMNAPHGLIAGMDRSQLGPIVHSKCRSESSVSKRDSGLAELENNGESSQRKKMRI